MLINFSKTKMTFSKTKIYNSITPQKHCVTIRLYIFFAAMFKFNQIVLKTTNETFPTFNVDVLNVMNIHD